MLYRILKQSQFERKMSWLQKEFYCVKQFIKLVQEKANKKMLFLNW